MGRNRVFAYIPPTPLPPITQPGLVATPVSPTQINLVGSYSPPPGLALYNFSYSTLSNSGPWTPLASQASPAYSHMGLTASSTYYYRVIVTTNEVPARTSAASAVQTAVTPASSGGYIKNHQGHYMASFNVNGTGNNGTEFAALAATPNCRGWLGNYTWDAIERFKDNYSNNSTRPFGNIIQDFNDLQAAAPGKRMTILIGTRRFYGTGKAPGVTITSGGGVPAYILSDSSYGNGTNGTQFGYTLATFQSVASGGDGLYHEIAAAVWRPAVNNRLIAMYQALAATAFVTAAGPYAGQTFTFDTHPLIEDIFVNDESALDLNNTTGTGYSDSALRAQYAALMAAASLVFTHTNVINGLNYTTTQSTTKDYVADTFVNRCGMGGPDVYISPHGTWAQYIYKGYQWNGTSFVPGGIDYRNQMPLSMSVQSPDYGKYGATVAQIYTAATEYAPYKIYWTITSTAFWNSDIKPTINANPNLNTGCPASYGGTCFAG